MCGEIDKSLTRAAAFPCSARFELFVLTTSVYLPPSCRCIHTAAPSFGSHGTAVSGEDSCVDLRPGDGPLAPFGQAGWLIVQPPCFQPGTNALELPFALVTVKMKAVAQGTLGPGCQGWLCPGPSVERCFQCLLL